MKGDKATAWKGRLIKKSCLVCDKEFKAKLWKVERGLGKFCSLKCFGEWESQNRRGEKASRWKGGLTSIAEVIRSSKKYNQWRQSVFIRDNFTCQECGDESGGNLEVHHCKKFFSELLEEVRKYLPLLSLYDGAMIYTPLWDIDNGVTLCERCHDKKKKKRK